MANKTNITKKCRACEINFDRLKERSHTVSDYHFPKDIPVSKEMRKTVESMIGKKIK